MFPFRAVLCGFALAALTSPALAQGKGGGKGGGGGGGGGDPPPSAEIVYADGASLWVMAPDGSQKTRVFTGPNKGAWVRCPRWSPDGTQIAFAAELAAGRGIYAVNTDGSGLRKVVDTTSSPAWLSWSPAPAPDGEFKICYADHWNGSADLFIVNPDGSGRVNLTASQPYENAPTWSPDGARIAAVRGFSELVVYELGVVGDEVAIVGESVVAAGKGYHFPAWAKAHEWIAFSAGSPTADIVIADLGTPDGLFAVTDTPAVNERWVSFSPDDSMIVYHGAGICRSDVNGANMIVLSNKGNDPDWKR